MIARLSLCGGVLSHARPFHLDCLYWFLLSVLPKTARCVPHLLNNTSIDGHVAFTVTIGFAWLISSRKNFLQSTSKISSSSSTKTVPSHASPSPVQHEPKSILRVGRKVRKILPNSARTQELSLQSELHGRRGMWLPYWSYFVKMSPIISSVGQYCKCVVVVGIRWWLQVSRERF